MAGVVEKVGAGVRNLKPGDRVWTSTYYRDVRAGCFQKFVVVPQHTVLHIPLNVGFESAACLGVGALTAAMTLRKWLDVSSIPPSSSTDNKRENGESHTGKVEQKEEEEWLLVWGGATVTGQFATQIASQSGFKVITVTSTRTKPLSLSLGASYVISRDGKTNVEIVAEIKSVMSSSTPSSGRRCITRAIDLVGPATASFALDCLASHRPVIFAPLAMISSKTPIPANVTIPAVEMKQFVLDKSSRQYAVEINRLIEAEALKLPELLVLTGGLGDVVRGLEMVKAGDMGGRKIVVRVG
jgi:NADPH:quinone reductase-like Zn-dependent oxidoreductase